ncbi:MAG: hypothetical protein QOD06_3501, partial [Candidatus Binatota bacterium]|nr:hypothetical protein [Candidatus Binatota bacterium]
CRGCHMPPVDSPELRDQRSKYWTRTNRYGKRFLKVSVINLAAIGTDPTAAVNWYQRVAETNDLGLGTVGAGEALEAVTTHVAERAYDELRLSESERAEWNGYRDPAVRAPLGYKARPLDGIWATGPYLHNASVRSLYELLLPASERARSFSLGSREFDPREVGFVSARNGAWTLRTDEPGNSNAGHEFRDAPIGAGVIGRELTDDERWDLVEYLKTL